MTQTNTAPTPELDLNLPPVEPTPFPELTTREREVAHMLVRGLKNSEIAQALGVSSKTVDTHRGHILKKLGKRNNVELTRLAFANGWTSASSEIG